MARMIAQCGERTNATQRLAEHAEKTSFSAGSASLCVRSSLVVVVLWPARRLRAHDLERTQVLLAFERDGSFVLDVANDPSWLKLRLETVSRQLRRSRGAVGGRPRGAADVGRVHPRRRRRAPTHRLRGRMPTDAHTLRWYYGLVIDPYPLAVRRADGRVVIEEIRGDAWSGTIDSDRPVPRADPGSTIVGVVLLACCWCRWRCGSGSRRKTL